MKINSRTFNTPEDLKSFLDNARVLGGFKIDREALALGGGVYRFPHLNHNETAFQYYARVAHALEVIP